MIFHSVNKVPSNVSITPSIYEISNRSPRIMVLLFYCYGIVRRSGGAHAYKRSRITGLVTSRMSSTNRFIILFLLSSRSSIPFTYHHFLTTCAYTSQIFPSIESRLSKFLILIPAAFIYRPVSSLLSIASRMRPARASKSDAIAGLINLSVRE